MMRRSVFLTLLIALFSTAAAWAEFNPTPGVKYALQEKTSGLYLDIQTLGIYDPPVYEKYGVKTNNISLSSSPCAIYFEAYDEWTWSMKNVNGQYVNSANYAWNPEIGNTKQNWFVVENKEYIKIHYWNSYIVENTTEGGNTTEGTPLYLNNTDAPLEFSLVDFVEQVQEYTLQINAPEGMPVTVEYDGQTIANGGTITTSSSINKNLFTATNLDGYTWEVVVDRVNHTITLVYTQVVQGGELNGYYHIYYKNGDATVPLFIGYNTEVSSEHKILGQDVYSTDAEGDKVFAIVPQGDGYTIAAQGKSLLAPNFNSWDHIQFSDESDAAGVYLFHETSLAGVFKIQGVGENDGDWLHNDYLQVYNTDGQMIVGPNLKDVAHDFLVAPVTSYPITIPAMGYLPLCLPFNVVLSQGVEAYDINDLSPERLSACNFLEKIAEAGQILQAGTPVILKGSVGNHTLELTMSGEGAIGSLSGSVLRGNYVKKTIKATNQGNKEFVFKEDMFEAITGLTEIPANSCWVEADLDEEDIELVPKYITISTGCTTTDWKFRVKKAGKGLTITECVQVGDNSVLEIGEKYIYEYEVDGETAYSTEELEINAISDQLLAGNEFITEVHFPKTLTSVGSGYANFMFELEYCGVDNGAGENIGVPEETGTEEEWTEDEKNAYAEAHAWIGRPHACRYNVLGTSTWRMTVDVTKSADAEHFNDYGSCLLATKENTLADDYSDGSMQLYLRQDKGIAFKLDTNGDRYVFNKGNQYGLDDAFSFTFVLVNDGAGGYKAKVTFEDGTTEEFEILANDHAELQDFNDVWSSLGSGIDVKVKFEKLTNKGLFADCVNLKKIVVDPLNPSFMGCDHGVLYNRSQTHVIRFPEDGGHNPGEGANVRRHFETPYTVTMVYAGALHGVDADIVFHSNPLIMYVEDHKDDMKATYYLSLDDDSDPNDGKNNYAVDFVSANENTYQSARYRRAPLAEGTFGTITLPFIPNESVLARYDFYRFVGGYVGGEKPEDNYLSFSKINSSEVTINTPYLYRLKKGVEPSTDPIAFETSNRVTIVYKPHYVPVSDAPSFEAVGTFINDYVATVNFPGSWYYYLSATDGLFHRVTKKLNYRPYRAFFVITPEEGQATQAPAKLSLRIIDADGSTTEITPEQVEGLAEPIYYDLMGRRVLNPTNGIYIVNGKKVVIK